MIGRRTLGALAAALALAVSSPARAQSPAEKAAMAQGLYEAGTALLKRGEFAAACPKLEESQRLDPAQGTEFFLATCYEATGRPTSAWSMFLDVAAQAHTAGNPTREATARGRAAVLEPKLPRLTVVVPDAVAALPGLVVERDGVELRPLLWGTAVPVDLGDHHLVVRAPGRAPWEVRPRIDRLEQRISVTVPLLEPGPRAEPPAPATWGPAARRTTALVTGSLGIAGLAVGTGVGIGALVTWHQAEAKCPARAGCSAEAHDLSTRSLGLARASTIAFAAGSVALAGATILWLTTPAPDRAGVGLVPLGGPGVAGAAAAGVF